MADIEELKAKVEDLKSKIETERSSKQNGTFDEMEDSLKTGMKPTVANPKARRTLKGHFGKVYAVQWAGNALELVSASQDGKLIIWNGHTTNKMHSIPLRSSWVMTCAIEQNDGRFVACGGLDNLCSIYAVTESESVRASKELAGHDGYISCCRFMGERNILTSSGDSTIVKWDIEKSKPEVTLTDHTGDVMSVALPPDDFNTFVSGSCDSTCRVWDIRIGKSVQTHYGHESDVNSVSFVSNAHTFGSGSDDSSCRMFDLRSYGEMNVYGNDKIVCGITSVSFSKSGRLLFAGYDDYNCYAWDTIKVGGNNAFQMTGHENRISCVDVNNTGQALCTGSWDTFLKIWA